MKREEKLDKKDMTRNIKYSGLEDTRASEQAKQRVKQVVEDEAEKFQRTVQNVFDMRLHIKEYEKDGKQHRYESKLKFSYPGSTVASQGHDWDIMTSVRKALEGVDNQLRSRFKREQEPGSAPRSRTFGRPIRPE